MNPMPNRAFLVFSTPRRSGVLAAAGVRGWFYPLGWGRGGAALLEVVISVTILLAAMLVVGGAFHNGIYYIERAERMSRARIMSERMLVELETGILDMKEREQSGYFGEEALPGMSWRVEINPHDRIPRLLTVDIYIYMGDPDAAPGETERILFTRVLHAEPRGIDLKEDAGLDDDQITQLMEAIPGGAGVADPANLDLRTLAQMDLDQLAELLPTLIQAFGVNISNGQMSQAITALQSGDLSALQGAAQQVGGQLPGMGGVPGAAGAQSGAAGSPPGGGRTGAPPGGGRRQGAGAGGPSAAPTRQGIGERRKGGGQ